jgi:hypothetical protein
MSTDNEIQDTSSRGDLILMPRQRQRSSQPLLPADPMDEELARDWTLSEADMAEVRRSRGEQHRRRFALQLCTLRNTGRFLDDYRSVPLRIINHIGCQLELPPVLWVAEPERHATESAYEERIRQYLGYRTFDQSVQEQLKRSLEKRAAEGLLPVELLHRAEAELRAWRCRPPQRWNAWSPQSRARHNRRHSSVSPPYCRRSFVWLLTNCWKCLKETSDPASFN